VTGSRSPFARSLPARSSVRFACSISPRRTGARRSATSCGARAGGTGSPRRRSAWRAGTGSDRGSSTGSARWSWPATTPPGPCWSTPGSGSREPSGQRPPCPDVGPMSGRSGSCVESCANADPPVGEAGPPRSRPAQEIDRATAKGRSWCAPGPGCIGPGRGPGPEGPGRTGARRFGRGPKAAQCTRGGRSGRELAASTIRAADDLPSTKNRSEWEYLPTFWLISLIP
jgi:hypothetical protein